MKVLRAATDAFGSVRARIMAWVIVLTALAMTGAAGAAYLLETERIDRRIDRSLKQEIDEFTSFQRTGVDPENGQSFTTIDRLLEVALSRNVPDEHQTLAAFVGDTDAPLAPVGGELTLHNEPGFRDAATSSDRPRYGDYESADGQVRFAAMPVVKGEERGTFVVAAFTEREHAELAETIRTYIAVAVVALALVALVGWLTAGRLLRPVHDVRRTAERISQTDLARRIAVTGRDDVSMLARTFNDMLDRLEDAFANQRRFLNDAGHELRTPITIVRGHIELLDVADPEEVTETQALVLDELDRMSRLVEDLVVLAKAERPDFLRIGRVDVGQLTEDVFDKARALGDRDWRIDELAGATVTGDGQRLTQALVQLAENAVKFTQDGDEVAIGSAASGDLVRLWVRDTGPGVPAGDEERIFDRFQRGPGSARADGSGLGLAIVRAIAEAHGGRAWLDRSPDEEVCRGARFVLEIPGAAAPGGGPRAGVVLTDGAVP
ncbi:sensor histidine kinase [Nocardioides speluncae]|uniref:sensor histidine kinase n=1 Tax=Nocardioides speluncae TaxID=2670337 RepID=UPI000D6865A7|nr:ATP-binding protein [Nocardioides speluncae]